MAIAQSFQLRNLAESRFNPFYGEMGGAPIGPATQRRTAPVRGGTPTGTQSMPVPEFISGFNPNLLIQGSNDWVKDPDIPLTGAVLRCVAGPIGAPPISP